MRAHGGTARAGPWRHREDWLTVGKKIHLDSISYQRWIIPGVINGQILKKSQIQAKNIKLLEFRGKQGR